MSTVFFALSVLGATLALALAVDRGIPNMLDSTAYHLEVLSRRTVAAIRRAARQLRQRHLDVENANRDRLEQQAI